MNPLEVCRTLCFVVGAQAIQNPQGQGMIGLLEPVESTTHNCRPPFFPSTTANLATPSVATTPPSVDLQGVFRELSAMRKEVKQAIANMQTDLGAIKRAVETLMHRTATYTIEKSPFKVYTLSDIYYNIYIYLMHYRNPLTTESLPFIAGV